MKLDHIQYNNLVQSANFISEHGVPREHLYNRYWVQLNDKEYPFKYLLYKAHEFSDKAGEFFDFNSMENYREFIRKKFHLDFSEYPERINFFQDYELEQFHTIVGRKYKGENPEDAKIGLRNIPLLAKTEYWAKKINMDGLIVLPDNKWQISGNFKPYTWARLYRPNDSDKKIFFTVGVDAPKQALVYKLDCLWSQTNKNKALKPEQVLKFRKYIQGSGAGWNQIIKDDLKNYDWERLIIETKRFIEDHLELYDEVIEYVWSKKPDPHENNEKPGLTVTEKPKGLNHFPDRNPKFKGVDRDFLGESRRNKNCGDAGETLVIKHEKKMLIKANQIELAARVDKVKDGRGFDILSFNTDGSEKHIEVKTTTGEISKPFPISWNEMEYIKQAKADYYLYRLYHFDPVNEAASLYILDRKDCDKLISRPLVYEAFVGN